MQREDLRIRLRRRSEWEAFELGRVMLREWRGPVYRAWAATYGIAAVIVVLATWPWPVAAPWILWWLKPFFDRVLLFVLGQCVFGRTASLRDVWRALPDIARRSGLLAGLTVRRLSPIRSLLLPVWQLERQRGAEARARARLISRRPWLHAAWLTTACGSIGLALVFSQVLLFELLMPVGTGGLFRWDLWMGPGFGPTALALLVAFTAVADTLVEPLYVAAGFSLYLNRRSDLEAWDVELGFRRLAERAPGGILRRAGAAVALVAAVWIGTAVSVLHGQTEGASPAASRPHVSGEPKFVIRDVLLDPVFGKETEVIEWQPKARADRSAAEGAPAILAFMRLIERAAALIRLLLWPAAALVVAWLVSLLIKRHDRQAEHSELPPAVLFGVDVRPESLPADVAARARELIQAGQLTVALGLLYRASLSTLVHRAGVRFRAGDTESDCVRRAEPALSGAALGFFGDLVQAWQMAAYASNPPGPDRALSLCDDWSVHFGREGGAR